MKIVALLAKLFAGIIAITIALVIAIIALVDPNDYRGQITDVVKEHTGRDLQIGNMGLSFFPHFGLSLEKVTLSNAQGFSNKHFFTADEISVGAEILPLLNQELVVDAVKLHNMGAYLEKNRDGISNWQDLLDKTASPTAETTKTIAVEKTTPQPTTENTSPLQKLAALSFGGLDIENSSVHWNDAQSGLKASVQIAELATEAISLNEFFAISFDMRTSLSQPKLESRLTLSSQIKVNEKGEITLKTTELTTNVNSSELPIRTAEVTLSLPELLFALDSQTLNMPNAVISYDVNGAKDFAVSQTNGKLTISQFSAQLQKQVFKADKLQLQTQVEGDVIPNKRADVNLQLTPFADLSKEHATIKQLVLSAYNTTVKADADVKKLLSKPVATLSTQIQNDNVRQLIQQLGITLPEMADSTSLKQAKANIDLQFDLAKEALQVSKLHMMLDETNITGTAGLKQFSTPNIHYSLALDKINVSRYLPPKKEVVEPSVKPTDKVDFEIPLPVEFIRSLTIDGKFTADSVKYDKIHASKVLSVVKGSKGKIVASPTQANAFNTTLSVYAALDVSDKTPRYQTKVNTKALPIGDALIAAADIDLLAGKGSVDTDIKTQGSKLSELKKGLNGYANLDLKDGAVKGFNLAQSIRKAQASMGGKPSQVANEPLQTDFSELIAQFTIKNGVVHTKNLSAQAPYMRVKGAGNVNLVNETLDYLVKVKIVGTDQGQGGQSLQDLAGLTIPVKLTGSYYSPEIGIDLGALIEEKTKAELEQQKAAIQQKLDAERQKLAQEAQRKADAERKRLQEQAQKQAQQKIQEEQKKVEQQMKDALINQFKF